MSEARQIQSMIDFIEREAQEKAEELDSAAQEEYDVEKMRLVEAEKLKIRANVEKQNKQVDVDRRVARANYSKMQRLRVMEERAKVMEHLQEETRKKIAAMVANPNAYKSFLQSIVRQSLLSIRTDSVIQCRKEDRSDIAGMIPELEKWYAAQTKTTITIKTSEEHLNSEETWGGVILVSAEGHIMCNNTLAYRAKTCFSEQLPTVRYYLFNSELTA